jgi:putative ABC transport system permease protein
LKSELERDAGVLSVGGSFFYPGIINAYDGRLYAEGKTNRDNQDVSMNYVDFDFLKTLRFQPLAGRLFSSQFPTDSVDGIILNEEAIRRLGYVPSDAVGKKVYSDIPGKTISYRIIGVVKDFHFQDLHSPIGAFCFMVNSVPNFNYVIAHVKSGNLSSTIASIQNTWHRLDPEEPFEYSLLDEQFQKNYEADNRLSAIIAYATAIAICISCLGLFGLATFSAERRMKEIGIRKVLGANASNIMILLSGEFLRLVFMAIVIGSPVGWFVMHKWLQDFAYRTSIGWTVFVYAMIVSIFIALLAISFQVIKAVTINPIKSLRSE